MNNKDIVISIAADSRKFLQGLETALASAEKRVKKSGVTDALERKFQDLNKKVEYSHKQIANLLSSISDSKLDDTVFDSMTAQLKHSLKVIHNLFLNSSSLGLDIDFSNADSLDTFISQAAAGLGKFNVQSLGLQKNIDTVISSFQALGDSASVIDSASLWVEIGSKVDNLFNGPAKVDKRTKAYKKAIQEILDIYQEYIDVGGSASLPELANITASAGIDSAAASALEKAYQKQMAARAVTEELASSAQNAENAAGSLAAASKHTANASAQAAGSLDAQTAALNNVNASAENLADSINDVENAAAGLSDINNDASDSAQASSEELNSQADVLKEITQTVQESRDSIGVLKSMGGLLADGINTLFAFVLKPFSLEGIIGSFKNLVATVTDLDDSLTKMRLSSSESLSVLKRFQKESFALGQSVGSTAQDIQNAAAGFLNKGYGLQESAALAKNAAIYSNISNSGVDQATDQMLSSIKTWKKEFYNDVEASEAIIDRFAAVGSSYSLSTAGLASQVEKSAAALKASGSDLNEAISIVAANTLLDQNIDTASEALKILSLRIRGAVGELKGMGADVGGLSNSPDILRAQIKDLTNVDILKNGNEFKSAIELVKELGAAYKDLSDDEKSSLLQKLVGNGDTSAIQNLLENYTTLESVMGSVDNADGTALSQNEKYLDSISGKVTQFHSQLQELAYVSLDDSFLKDLVSMGTQVLKVVTALIEKLGALPAVIAAFSGALSLKKNFGRVKMLPS